MLIMFRNFFFSLLFALSLRAGDLATSEILDESTPLVANPNPPKFINYLKKNPRALICIATGTGIVVVGGYIALQEIIRSFYDNGVFNLPYSHSSNDYTICAPACLHNPDFPVYWTDLELVNFYGSPYSLTNCSIPAQEHRGAVNMTLAELAAERTGCDSSFLDEVQNHLYEYEQNHGKVPDYLLCAPQKNGELCCANAWFSFPQYNIRCLGYWCLQVFKTAHQLSFAHCMVSQALSTWDSPLSLYIEICGSLFFFFVSYALYNGV